jgi:hypothetical protein
MHPPHVYYVPEGMICHLHRSLYGLKQAPRTWFLHFAYVTTVVGFSTSACVPALFIHVSPRGRTLLYMDDRIITGDDIEYIFFVKARLSKQFLMSNLGHGIFLGFRSHPRSRGSFCLKRSIFRIFSIELLLLIVGPLRLP